MIGGRRPIAGRKPGDKRIRVERPHSPYFRYAGPGQLTAKPAANAPTTAIGRITARVKGVLIGRPLHTEEEIGERLSKKKALAIFSSDAISSSAYATEEIVLAFILAGFGGAALNLSLPVSIAIAVLLGVVAFSYRHVCIAYPTGGGSYSVSRSGRDVRTLARQRPLDAPGRVRHRRSTRGGDVAWPVGAAAAGVPLVIVESPSRALVGPVVTYLDVLDRAWPPDVEAPATIVVLPQYVARHWWDRLLNNRAAKRLKAALVGRERTVIANVPYRHSGNWRGSPTARNEVVPNSP